MSHQPHYMLEGDLAPILEAYLRDETGALVDWTGKTPVTFKMCHTNGVTAITGTASVDVSVPGRARYTWTAGQTATAGTYYATFKDNTGKSYPNDGTYLEVVIGDDRSAA
ncbi:MAG TPA: hypothetical protein VD948_02420 [Rhodothermales bacterium]|nr:hypothetical protein [Rhodothermales bacterium]